MTTLDGRLTEVLRHDAPAAVVTTGPEGPHLVGTWNTYIQVLDDHTIAYPAAGMNTTQRNLQAGSSIQLLVGTKEVEGRMGPGTGFRLTGRGRVEESGSIYDRVKSRFDWARGAVVVDVDKVEQLT